MWGNTTSACCLLPTMSTPAPKDVLEDLGQFLWSVVNFDGFAPRVVAIVAALIVGIAILFPFLYIYKIQPDNEIKTYEEIEQENARFEKLARNEELRKKLGMEGGKAMQSIRKHEYAIQSIRKNDYAIL